MYQPKDPKRRPRNGARAAVLYCAVMIALAAGLSRAQEAPPAVFGQPSAEQPAAASPGLLLNFQNVPLGTVLDYLSEEAGFVVVQEAAVQGTVTVTSRQPLSPAEAVSLLNTVLGEEGFAAVRNGRVLKIVTQADAKKMNVPVRTGADPSVIEPNEDIVTQVIPLKFADAVQLKQDLATLIPAYADLSANASTNALILTDTGANVRRIVEIVQALDSHLGTVADVRIFALTYAKAADAAKLINDVFGPEETTAGQQANLPFGVGRFFRGPGGGPEAGQAAATTSRAPRVTAVADERTNSVVVTGPADTLTVVAQVVAELENNPAETDSVLVYSLKNAKADSVATLLNDLFSQSEKNAQTPTARAGGQQQAGGRGGAMQIQQAGAQGQEAGAQAPGSLAGKSYCVADADTNTLLILTAPSNFARLRAIVTELDRPIPQVIIKVLIAEVTWSKDLDVGFEFGLDRLSSGEDHVFTDFGVEDTIGAPGLDGGFFYKLVHGDLTAALRALEKLGKLDILSRPHILASDNQEATITVGKEVPFITNSRTTETGQTINTIQYEDIGIILKVTPHINPEGLVIMDVAPEISTTTSETVPISETVSAPVFAKRSAQTRIAVRDGQTVVIGGLMQDQKIQTVRRVPILGSIPLLGALFRRTVDETEKTELLIFLTPHVALEANQLEGMSSQELSGVSQMKDAVEPGVFQEHMEGMQLGGKNKAPATNP